MLLFRNALHVGQSVGKHTKSFVNT